MATWEIDEIARLCLAIQQVPAPTGAEHGRAEFVAAEMRRMGLTNAEIDDAPNVYARIAGVGAAPALMLSAHLDTVFPAGTDLTNRRQEGRLFGPGVGDNSMGLAGLLTIARRMLCNASPPACDVWFVANAGEEGLGDLRGMRSALDRLGGELGGCIVVEGAGSGSWTITHRGLGVRRYRIEASARGGHSWSSFGEPSAIHLLVRLASVITRWDVPKKPRTTFNIGVIEGGTSINSIAEHASLLLDLRSEDALELNRLTERTEELVMAANAIGDGRFTATVVGDRPTGEIPIDHPLVSRAAQILNDLGVRSGDVEFRIGSTDANIPLSRGIPAVTLYLTEGHAVHTTSEWLSLDRLSIGMSLVWQLAEWLTSTVSGDSLRTVQRPAPSAE